MDVFKVLLPMALATGLFVKPIPWLVKVGAGGGFVVLFWMSIWMFPKGES